MDRRWLRLQAAAMLLCVCTVLMLRMRVSARSLATAQSIANELADKIAEVIYDACK